MYSSSWDPATLHPPLSLLPFDSLMLHDQKNDVKGKLISYSTMLHPIANPVGILYWCILYLTNTIHCHQHLWVLVYKGAHFCPICSAKVIAALYAAVHLFGPGLGFQAKGISL
eukprot:12039911-Ditylum_brightwellii.AAC.3